MSEEEEGGGVGTTLLIVGAVGCGGLVMVGIFGALFFGASSSMTTMPSTAISTPVEALTRAAPGARTIVDLGDGNSYEEWTTIPADGTRTVTRITRIDGTSTELRLVWDALDAYDEAQSGLYEAGMRVRALMDEERTELGG